MDAVNQTAPVIVTGATTGGTPVVPASTTPIGTVTQLTETTGQTDKQKQLVRVIIVVVVLFVVYYWWTHRETEAPAKE